MTERREGWAGRFKIASLEKTNDERRTREIKRCTCESEHPFLLSQPKTSYSTLPWFVQINSSPISKTASSNANISKFFRAKYVCLDFSIPVNRMWKLLNLLTLLHVKRQLRDKRSLKVSPRQNHVLLRNILLNRYHYNVPYEKCIYIFGITNFTVIQYTNSKYNFRVIQLFLFLTLWEIWGEINWLIKLNTTVAILSVFLNDKAQRLGRVSEMTINQRERPSENIQNYSRLCLQDHDDITMCP